MALQKDYTYEAAYTSPTTEAASGDTITSGSVPNPFNSASWITYPGNSSASIDTSSPITHEPTWTSHTVINNISVGPPEPTWSMVSSQKKKKKKKKIELQARLTAEKVAEEGHFFHEANLSGQVVSTEGGLEQAQLQTAPTTSKGSEPFRKPKPRGKRAGKLVAKRQTTTTIHMISKKRSSDSTIQPPHLEKCTRMESSQSRDSYAAAFKANALCVAIMTEPYSELTAKQGNDILTCLENKLVEDLLNPLTAAHMADVGFRGKAHFSEAVLKMWCEDNVALQWLRSAVENTPSPIAGSKLVVRPQSEIQRRILCGLFVPDTTLGLNSVRQILTAQNRKTLDVRSWTLVKSEYQTETGTPGIYLLFRIPVSEVDKLKQQDRRVNWMLGNIYVRILAGESKTSSSSRTPALPAPTPALSEPTTPTPETETVDTVDLVKIKVEQDQQ